MESLSPSIIESFTLALRKLTGYDRRSYAAALAIKHFDGSARKAERVLSVSRQMVELGLKEQATGIRCEDGTLKKVRKSLPLKRIAQTDAIFENIAWHRKRSANGVLKLSVDVKTKLR